MTTAIMDQPITDELLSDELISDEPISDEELTLQALAADPDAPLAPDSVPWAETATGLLPDWYMPGTATRRRGGWRAVVALAVVVGLVAINAAGLCITYGHLVIA
jgi:hypothetical protein